MSIDWNENVDIGWLVMVDGAPWQPGKNEGEFFKQLDCPRCGHHMRVESGQIIVLFEDNWPDMTVARCNCREQHSNRPEDKYGCGYAGLINSPNAVYQSPRPLSTSDLAWEKKAVEFEFSRLERIKKAAAAWATTTTALVGLFGISAYVKGLQDITKLQSAPKNAVISLLFLTILGYVVAVSLAALASHGIPKQIGNTPLAFRRAYVDAAKMAARLLGWSRVAAIVATVLFGAMLGVLVLGDRLESEKSFLVLSQSGQVYCGPIESEELQNGELGVFEGSPAIASITIVESCE